MITDKESPTIGDIGKLALNNLSTSLEQAVRTSLVDKLLKQHGYRFNLPCGANMPTLKIIPHPNFFQDANFTGLLQNLTSCNKLTSVVSSYNKSVKISLVATCHSQAC